MKTLDEVIEELENLTTCDGTGYSYIADDDADDALHYLKEFKRISARLEKIALGNITETLEKLDNPALTWNELKTMEGKPVWMEDNTGTKFYRGWAIILDFKFAEGNFMHYECNDYSETCVDVEDLGKTWNAYRKERG